MAVTETGIPENGNSQLNNPVAFEEAFEMTGEL